MAKESLSGDEVDSVGGTIGDGAKGNRKKVLPLMPPELNVHWIFLVFKKSWLSLTLVLIGG